MAVAYAGKVLLVVTPVSMALLHTVGYVAEIHGTSMQPTLNPNGGAGTDKVFVSQRGSRLYDIHRGDVVAVTAPNNPRMKLIKRVIGVAGDTVVTRNYKNVVVVVPPGYLWIEGDNGQASLDSNTFGPVHLGLVTGKVNRIIWPPHRWGRIPSVERPLPVTPKDQDSIHACSCSDLAQCTSTSEGSSL